MKTLKKGILRCNETRILQGMLNLHGAKLSVDGSFGSGTRSAVILFQKEKGLVADGIAGPATQRALGILPASNSRIVTIRIPFSAIIAQGLILKDKTRVTFGTLTSTKSYNFSINGPMFDTRSYAVVNDVVNDGKLINGGNYSDKGIAMYNSRSNGCMYYTNTTAAVGKKVDFVAGSPTLIINGKKSIDAKGLGKSYLNQSTIWNCMGCDESNFYYMTSLSRIKLNAMAVEGLAQGIDTLINLDGGGSRALSINQKVILPTDGRAIPCAIGLKVNL